MTYLVHGCVGRGVGLRVYPVGEPVEKWAASPENLKAQIRTYSESENKNAFELLKKADSESFSINYVSSLENELKINTFFRLKESSIIKSIQEKGEPMKDTSPKEVFLALRRLRNNW